MSYLLNTQPLNQMKNNINCVIYKLQSRYDQYWCDRVATTRKCFRLVPCVEISSFRIYLCARMSGDYRRANFPIIGRDSWEMIDKFISLRMLNVDEYGYRHFYHNAEQYCYLYAILFISKGIWRTKYEKSIQLCLLIVFDKLRYPLPYKRGKFLSLKLIFIESVLYLLPKMYQRIIIHAH